MEYDDQQSETSAREGLLEDGEDEREEGEVDEAAWDDDKVRTQARDALEMSVREYEDKWGRGAARDGSRCVETSLAPVDLRQNAQLIPSFW